MANAFHLLSGVNINKKRICVDRMRPHLLKCVKSGHFTKFSSSKPDKNAVHCLEKQLNLMYFCSYRFPP